MFAFRSLASEGGRPVATMHRVLEKALDCKLNSHATVTSVRYTRDSTWAPQASFGYGTTALRSVPQGAPTYYDILDAGQSIKGNVIDTPLVRSRVLSELVGGHTNVYLKYENLQNTASDFGPERGGLFCGDAMARMTLAPRVTARQLPCVTTLSAASARPAIGVC